LEPDSRSKQGEPTFGYNAGLETQADNSERRERVWRYYRNLVHAVYREARHVGPPGDADARVIVSATYQSAAHKCRINRSRLKSSVPFREVKTPTTDAVISAYQALTDLAPADLVVVFNLPGWRRSFGGKKWAAITQVLIRLKQEIDQAALDAACETCEDILNLQHNSGPLVPTLKEWREIPYLREKWPEPWEADG
jgi:hypothetical protein